MYSFLYKVDSNGEHLSENIVVTCDYGSYGEVYFVSNDNNAFNSFHKGDLVF